MSDLHSLGIDYFKAKYGLEVFVETGAAAGNGLRHAESIGFTERYSCDLNPDSVQQCSGLGEVHHADSLTFLKSILPKIANKPCCFWLDAHYPESYSDAPGTKFPLPDELRILAQKPGIEHDVILCDDLRVLRSPDNPTYSASNYLGHLPAEYYLVDMPVKALTDILPLQSRIVNAYTGVLVFEPC